MHLEFNVEGGDFTRAGYASSEIKKLLKRLNVDTGVIKRTVVAAYEAEVNIVAHAYSGTIYADVEDHSITLTFRDEGPGIADIEKAMEEGYSTASEAVREMGFGAGMGLSNIKKNADKLDISSEVDKGTMLVITMKLNA
ncbi:MAG: ATP-binding protein [Bacteroidales bacterium]|nr:ATP-binding protein [Bacteroidales bacterium]